MRFLLVSDLHYALQQYDWTTAVAPGFDAVVIAGDHLDGASSVDGGVQIVVILFGDDEIRRQLKLGHRALVYLHEGTGLMLAVGARQFVVASDFAEALVAYFDDPARGVYTRSDTVVFLAETMIRHEIYLAEIMQVYGAQIEKRFGKGKALSILAHKLGRAAYFMLAREKAFDVQRFLATGT